MTAKSILAVDYEKCTGCHLCELACSIIHHGKINPYLSRITILSKPETQASVPIYCLQCNEAPCAQACPTNAIQYDEETSSWIISYGKCIGCRECMYACPFGAISLGTMAEPLKCDLCGGNPVCVEACPHNALIYGSQYRVQFLLKTGKSASRIQEPQREALNLPQDNKVRKAEKAVETIMRMYREE